MKLIKIYLEVETSNFEDLSEEAQKQLVYDYVTALIEDDNLDFNVEDLT
jgi:acid stress-induced BolA-like protein IbaG/YrbA